MRRTFKSLGFVDGAEFDFSDHWFIHHKMVSFPKSFSAPTTVNQLWDLLLWKPLPNLLLVMFDLLHRQIWLVSQSISVRINLCFQVKFQTYLWNDLTRVAETTTSTLMYRGRAVDVSTSFLSLSYFDSVISYLLWTVLSRKEYNV